MPTFNDRFGQKTPAGRFTRNPRGGDLQEAAESLAERDQPVASSAIASLGYDFRDDTMRVTFTDGSAYEYEGVDLNTYVTFVRSPSKGRFFNSAIRPYFSFRRI